MFFTWLYQSRSTRPIARSRSAGGSGRVPVDGESVQISAPPDEGPASQAEHEELREALDLAIAELTPPYRTALVLRDVEGLSTREAAEIAGVGEAAFKSRLHQARLRVRAALTDAALIASTT